jgi:hypothetical protein
MTLNRTHLASAALALALAACSSPKPGTPEFVQKKEEDQQKAVVKTVEQSVAVTPDWYKKNPVDPNALYAMATEASTNRQMAVDRAMHLARKELAQQLGARVSGTIRDFATDSDKSNDDFQTQIKAVGESVALDVNVAGYVRENDEVVAEGGKYRAFVMLRYPVGEINKVIASQVKKNSALEKKVEASKAWQALEQEIEAAKKK